MEKAKTAENESPVTAEDFYYSQAESNRWLRDIMPHEEDHLKYMLEEYGQLCAEQARQEERRKSFEMLEKWSILNKEHYRDVSGLIQKTREIIERDKAIIGYDPVLKCKCEMPAKIHGKNLCWRCKRSLS